MVFVTTSKEPIVKKLVIEAKSETLIFYTGFFTPFSLLGREGAEKTIFYDSVRDFQ